MLILEYISTFHAWDPRVVRCANVSQGVSNSVHHAEACIGSTRGQRGPLQLAEHRVMPHGDVAVPTRVVPHGGTPRRLVSCRTVASVGRLVSCRMVASPCRLVSYRWCRRADSCRAARWRRRADSCHIYNRLPFLQISMFRSSSQDLVAASGQRRPAKPSGGLYGIQSTTTCCTDCVVCPQSHMDDS